MTKISTIIGVAILVGIIVLIACAPPGYGGAQPPDSSKPAEESIGGNGNMEMRCKSAGDTKSGAAVSLCVIADDVHMGETRCVVVQNITGSAIAISCNW